MEYLSKLHTQLVHQYYRLKCKQLKNFLFAVGSLYLLKQSLKLIPAIRFRRNLQSRYGQDSWAVVTGGSDGIGKEFCLQLASEGFNIAIVARTMQKMDQVCKECQIKYGVQTKIIQADFAEGTTIEFYQRIEQQLSGLDVSILVNNVGITDGGAITQLSMDVLMNLVNVNALGTMLMTKVLFNRLLARQHKSAVITISSGLASLPTPYTQTYCATKAFQYYFSQSLKNSYNQLDFLVAQPLGVSTPMMRGHQGPLMVTPESCVKSILDDFKQGKSESYGHPKHRRAMNYLSWLSTARSQQMRIDQGNFLMKLRQQ